ncbi:MAG: ABC transporter permease [Gemmataceae bacterium]|nr:ABC transporter permease [Gemmataceae bacterium]
MRDLLTLPAVWVLAAVAAVFAALSPQFLTAGNLINVLIQSSAVGIVATGMTFVLLTAGIDLSVGSVMFLGAAVCGVLVGGGWPWWAGAVAMLAVGPACGLLHGLAITRLGLTPFVVTLSSLFVIRGLGLWVSRTRAMNLPDDFRQLATERVLGVPVPVWLFGVVLLASQWVVGRTRFGRHVLAVGHDAAAARKAGLDVGGVLVRVYLICGACAALGGLVALAQLSAVSPTFGRDREFDAIAAAVLGGASLFGGRGNVLPGVLVGAVTIQTVYNGLNLIDADPYSYPVITGGVVFLAVLADSLRNRLRGGRP